MNDDCVIIVNCAPNGKATGMCASRWKACARALDGLKFLDFSTEVLKALLDATPIQSKKPHNFYRFGVKFNAVKPNKGAQNWDDIFQIIFGE